MKKYTFIFLAVVLLVPIVTTAQIPGVGMAPFGSYSQFGFDTVNNKNLNTILNIPIVSSSGRGLPLNLALTYNSQIYQFNGFIFSANNLGWSWDMPPGGTSTYDSSSEQVKCFKPGYPLWTTLTTYSGYAYTDALGNGHSFPTINWTYQQCGSTWTGTGSGYASDASGYYMTTGGGNVQSVKGPGGQQFPNSNTAVDTNGNFVSRNVLSSTETDWTDSVGNVALKILYTPNNTSPTQIQYEFQDGSGNYHSITLQLQTLNVATHFGCSGLAEHTGTATVPKELDIPSPTTGVILKYLFAYESYTANSTTYYTGRLQKVTLPTGGSYEYDYPGANDGANCSDGSALTMNRVVSDGTNSATWNFVRNTANRTTTVTTPSLPDSATAHDTVITFNTVGQETTRNIYAPTKPPPLTPVATS